MLGYIIFFAMCTTVYSSVVKISPAITSDAKITVSSTLVWRKYDYRTDNIFISGNTSSPDKCSCCYSSVDEQLPWLKIELPYRIHVAYIKIIGRTDFHQWWYKNERPSRNLQFMHIAIDGEEYPKNMSEFGSANNTVTVYPPSATTETVKITRPKPDNQATEWYLCICEIEFYERADIASGCPAGKDYMDLPWDRGANKLFTRQSCPNGYNGEAKRYCDENGVYKDPVYNCTSSSITDIYKQVSDDSVEAEPITVLKALTNVTSTEIETNGSILLGDMNAIIKIMSLVVDAVEGNHSDAAIEDLTDSFLETTSNIIGESTTTTWKTMINKTGVGADAVLDNVENFLEKTLNERDTLEFEKPNLYIKKEPTCATGEKGSLFPDRSKDRLPEWIEKTRDSIFIGCNDKRNTSSFSGIIYRNVSQIIQSTLGPESEDLQQKLNSPVVSFSYYPKVAGKLQHPVEITFQTYSNALDNPICTFWKKGKGAQGFWSRDGCWLHQYDKQNNIVICKCDHLTSFAVLMSLSPDIAIEHQLALNIITKTGLIISLVFLLLTIVVYRIFWRHAKSVQSIIKMNLSCVLFLANLLFLTGIDRTDNKIVCTAIAGLLHLLYVSVFAIMLALGLDLAYMMVKPMHTTTPGLRLLFIFYGLSVLIVAVSMGVVQLEGYGNERVCWLSVETGLIWTFLVPVMLTILMNLIIVAVVIKIMCGTTHMSKKTNIERFKSGVRGITVLMPVMGLTWLFGIFSIEGETVVFQFLFAVFNSLQGFFIFIFHCVMNEKIQVAGGKMRARWLSSESRNTTSELRN